MRLKSAFLLTAALLTTPAFATDDCTHYMGADTPMPYKVPGVGPVPVIAGWEQVSIDTIDKTVCYDLSGNPRIGSVITPSHKCVNVVDDKANDQKVTMAFPDKFIVDISEFYDSKAAKIDYMLLQQECVEKEFPPPTRDPLSIKPPVRNLGISYRAISRQP